MLQYQLPKTNVTIKGRKGNRKNYLEKGPLRSEPLKFELRETMIHKNLCIQYTLYEIAKSRKVFVFQVIYSKIF